MNIFESASLFFAMAVLAAVPSSSVALVVARSATLGVSNGIAVSIGIVLGDLVFIALAILGLTAVAGITGGLFVAIKFLAGGYLLWIGYSLLTSKDRVDYVVTEAKVNENLLISFFSGFLLTLGDVKAIFFYASFFPVFVDLTSISLTTLLTIALITVTAVGGVKIAYAVAARGLANLGVGNGLQTGAKKVTGCFMIGAGSYLILKS